MIRTAADLEHRIEKVDINKTEILHDKETLYLKILTLFVHFVVTLDTDNQDHIDIVLFLDSLLNATRFFVVKEFTHTKNTIHNDLDSIIRDIEIIIAYFFDPEPS